MININIQLSQLTTEIVLPLVISKLYNYAKVSKVEDPSNELEMHLSGNIQTHAAKKDEVRYLSGIDQEDVPKFPDLTITVPNNNYCVEFEDPIAKSTCVYYWGGASGGSTGVAGIAGEVTYGLLAAIGSIGRSFRSKSIIKFNEFLYFTSTTSVPEFYDCRQLLYIKLPSSIQTIGSGAFMACTSLKEINIPAAVESITGDAFAYCLALSKVNIASIYDWLKIRIDGGRGWTNPVFYSHKLFIDDLLVTNVEIPQNIYSIASCAFFLCTDITNITFHNNITSIGEAAFEGCSNAVFNTIPSSITSIGGFAFKGCNLPQSITLTNISLLGGLAFFGCSGITLLNYDSTYNIPNDCFRACSQLQQVVITGNITELKTGAFRDCSTLRFVRLHSTILNMDTYCFMGCDSINTFICEAANPPSITNTTMPNSNIIKIYVPDNSVNAYKTALYWDALADKIYPMSELPT